MMKKTLKRKKYKAMNMKTRPIVNEQNVFRRLIRGVLVASVLLFSCSMASAQIKVKGNVYGGGELGKVTQNATVTINTGTTQGSVFGGGMGSKENPQQGLVEGNTTVEMTGGTVVRSIYGGGELGSVGTFTTQPVTYSATDPNNAGVVVNVPVSCAENTGLATVTLNGGRVGVVNQALMPTTNNPGDDELGWVFCGGKGEVDSIQYPQAIAMGVVGSTHLTINSTNDANPTLVTASVYGGCENGLVLDNTVVDINGGQIGVGHYMLKEGGEWVHHWDSIYSVSEDHLWETAIAAVKAEDPDAINAIAAQFHECDAWPYGVKDAENHVHYYVYDEFADQYDSKGGATQGSNGHSFFGNVFGGGSGFYPMAPGIWRRTAGQVNGDVTVNINGGHILTSIYGGNEVTDVKGKCTVNMKGGTLGVPRTLDSIAAHPVTCYLFGAGMGDARILFNTWTHVNQVEVNVTGGTIFGSVFGGGEDGHVLNDVDLTIKETDGEVQIGTWGYSYVDGNVFGGGRGFTGDALTAGVVGGNVTVNIEGGKMLGSIYGGGRMASVGTEFATPTLPNGQPNPHYGHMRDGDDHGIITVNIKGGIIGNDYESKYHYIEHPKGGNVFAGAMGRLTLLDGSTNEMWPDLAKVKKTFLTINQEKGTTIIKGNVYGGAEFGTVTDSTSVDITAGTIWRDVYGGGYGSEDIQRTGTLKIFDGESVTTTTVTPLEWAGRVEGNTNVSISGSAWVKKCVYGGGELASVGTFSTEATSLTTSWPYKFTFSQLNNYLSGRSIVSITGGRIGITGKDYMGPWNYIDNVLVPVKYDDSGNPVAMNKDEIKAACKDNGDVFGAGKGKPADPTYRYLMNNVRESRIAINYEGNTVTPTTYNPTEKDNTIGLKYMIGYYPDWASWQAWNTTNHEVGACYCVTGAVYGGSEDGHVQENTKITLTDGLVGHAVYGGGKGKGKYNGEYSLTAGKVYGDTYININGGYVVRSVFGGGNLASMGKGNYIGIEGGDPEPTEAEQALVNASGRSYVNVYAGTLGMLTPAKASDSFKDQIPYGSVFGGSRGQVVNGDATSDDLFGFVNNTYVTIGRADRKSVV